MPKSRGAKYLKHFFPSKCADMIKGAAVRMLKQNIITCNGSDKYSLIKINHSTYTTIQFPKKYTSNNSSTIFDLI